MGTVMMTEDSVTYTGQQTNLRASGQIFQAKNGTANIGSATTSLFRAIESARKSSQSGAYVVMNSSETVFKMTTSSTYHKYQFDQYYGSTTSVSEAQAWIAGYNYSHIIDGTGEPVYDYLQSVKGGLTSTSTNTLIEKNVGAYYYNFEKASTVYKKMSVEVDLSSATLKDSDFDAYPHNGYIFVGAKQSYTFEAGLFTTPSRDSGTTFYPYYMVGDGNIYTDGADPIATGTVDSNGIVSFSDKIRITLAVSSGQQICKIENLTTGKTWSKTVSNNKVSGTASTQFLYATSLVPDDPSGTLNDLRSGAYLKNVKYSKQTLYFDKDSTSGVAAHPSSSYSQYAFLYNTDCGNYSSSGSGASTVETVSIFYDSQRT